MIVNNYKYYKPIKWSTKKSLRGCQHVCQHMFIYCAIFLESQFETLPSVIRSTQEAKSDGVQQKILMKLKNRKLIDDVEDQKNFKQGQRKLVKNLKLTQKTDGGNFTSKQIQWDEQNHY